MHVLVVDADGVGLAFAWRCTQAGHQVRLFAKGDQDIGSGFKGVEPVDNWVASVKWADLIVPTGNSDYLERLDFFRARGSNVFGPSQKSAQQGMALFEAAGIEQPEARTFRSLKAAEEYVWAHEGRYVFKGDSLSYVPRSPADLIAWLQRQQSQRVIHRVEVTLRDFVEGVEFGVSRFMGKAGFVGQWNEHFPCGVQKYTEHSELADDVLSPLEESLLEMGHLGSVDVACVVDGKGKAWPLALSCGLQWPAFNAALALHRGDPCQWMLDACGGHDTTDQSPDHAIGVSISQPDGAGIPIYGVTKKNSKYIQPQEVYISTLPDMDGQKVTNRPIWSTAGTHVAVVTGTGKNVSQAADRAYGTVEEIGVSGMVYEKNAGQCLKTQLTEMKKHGFAAEFVYGDE